MSAAGVQYNEAIDRLAFALVRLMDWETRRIAAGKVHQESLEGQLVAVLSRIAEMLGLAYRISHSATGRQKAYGVKRKQPPAWLGKLQQCITGFPFRNPCHRSAAQEELRQIYSYCSCTYSQEMSMRKKRSSLKLPTPYINRVLLPKWRYGVYSPRYKHALCKLRSRR